MSTRALIHTKASATLAMRAGGVLWLYRGMYSDPPSAKIIDSAGARTVRYTTAQALVAEMRLHKDDRASSWVAARFTFGGAA